MYIYKCYRSYYKFVIKYNISRKIHIATILEYDEKKTSRYNTLVRERTKGQHWKKKTEKNEEKMEKKGSNKKEETARREQEWKDKENKWEEGWHKGWNKKVNGKQNIGKIYRLRRCEEPNGTREKVKEKKGG